MDITLRQLEYFVALARERHFGRAAQAVNVSQPALSVQIRELEARLGTTLIERKPRELVLTADGHEVLRHAQRVLEETRALIAAPRRMAGLNGPLALGVIPTLAPYLLPVALPLLQKAAPRLDLRLRESLTDTLLCELAEGHLDAAVLALPLGAAGLYTRELFEDRFVLAGPDAAIAALPGAPDLLRPQTLPAESLLLLEEGHCLADQALDVCALDRGATRMDLSASSLSTLCRLAAGGDGGNGLGFTFLPEIALLDECRAVPGLAVQRFAQPEPRRQIALVRRMSSPGGAWFDNLAEILARAGSSIIASARASLPAREPMAAEAARQAG